MTTGDPSQSGRSPVEPLSYVNSWAERGELLSSFHEITAAATAATSSPATRTTMSFILKREGRASMDALAAGEVAKAPSPGSRLVEATGWVALAIVTVAWSRVTQDAWRLRSIVADYTSVHGGYDVHAYP